MVHASPWRSPDASYRTSPPTGLICQSYGRQATSWPTAPQSAATPLRGRQHGVGLAVDRFAPCLHGTGPGEQAAGAEPVELLRAYADGSPTASEPPSIANSEPRFGSMPGARKGADLRRDPRFALHRRRAVDPHSHPVAPRSGPGGHHGRAVPAACVLPGNPGRASCTDTITPRRRWP